MMASVSAKAIDLVSIHVIIANPSQLLMEIQLPILDGDWLVEEVEYLGLSNKCFASCKVNHFAKACPS